MADPSKATGEISTATFHITLATNRELDLAIFLLRQTEQPLAPARLPAPMPIPSVALPESESEMVECNLEILQQDKNLAVISGWAFACGGNRAGPLRPVLLFACDKAWFATPGVIRQRPDVVAVFPPSPEEEVERLNSGVVFEFESAGLPGPITSCRVMLADNRQFRGLSALFPFAHGQP